MPGGIVEAKDLPEAPLDAALDFYTRVVPEIREEWAELGEVVVVFDPAGHEHHAWREAAIQDLAREAAPSRVNGVVGDGEAELAETFTFLGAAPGVTGQLFAVEPR